jgi:hypothetical protein
MIWMDGNGVCQEAYEKFLERAAIVGFSTCQCMECQLIFGHSVGLCGVQGCRPVVGGNPDGLLTLMYAYVTVAHTHVFDGLLTPMHVLPNSNEHTQRIAHPMYVFYNNTGTTTTTASHTIAL